jgi:peptidoglycan/LPS O-acetylase OafA/YrhL
MLKFPVSKTLNYRPDIDGLRAVAVLLVVIFHFNLIPGGKSGFMGVDVFYVISGFLITAILTKQMDAGTFSFSSFYIHRVRRLAPALFAVLVLVMLAGSLFLFPAELIDLSKQVLASQLYVANIYYWRTINYFGLRADDVFLLHTWSLAVEEQFYLVYPLVFFSIYRFCRSRLWVILSILFAASFSLNLWFVSSKPEATFYLLPTRAWELLAGSLGFYAATHFARSRGVNELLGLIGLALVTAGVLTYSDGIAFPGAFALIPTLGAALVLIGGSGQQTTASRLLSVAPAVYIGRISYTLYLVHWPVNVFAKQLFTFEYSAPVRAAMCLFSIALSMAIFHLIEHPIRTGRLLSSGRWIVRTYGAGLAITIGLVSIAVLFQGFPQRFPSKAVHLANFVNDKTQGMAECEFQGKPLASAEHFCRIGLKDVAPDWLVIGDSHAYAGHDAFSNWLASQGKAGLFMFRNSCPPITGVHVFKDRGLCFAFNQSVATFLERHDSIRNVLMVSTWRQALEGRLSTETNLHLSKSESINLFEKRFASSIKYLNRLGKRIFIWEPVPGARGNVPNSMARAVMEGRPAGIEITRAEYLQEYAFFFKAMENQKSFIAQSFSPSAALCGSGVCQISINGNPLYYDNAHVTRSSADFWVAMLHEQYRQ